MEEYPEVLLPRRSYPPALSENEVLPYCLVRETQDNLYPLLEKDYEGDDIIRKIVEPQYSGEVFELSVFLYGYYAEDHVGIRVDDPSLYESWSPDLPDLSTQNIAFSCKALFPLYLSAENFYQKTIQFNNEPFLLSFSHKPTRVNYWHFQLWTQDANGNYIARGKKKILAKHILEQYVVRAICPKSEIKKFQFSSTVLMS